MRRQLEMNLTTHLTARHDGLSILEKKMEWFEAEELVVAALGLNDNEDLDTDAIEVALLDKLQVDLEQFKAVAEVLLPLTLPARTAITGDVFKGFVKDDCFIVKMPISLPSRFAEEVTDGP